MSPNVGNFVHDLVEMAKAMEELPGVKRELENVLKANADLQDTIQRKELRIIDLKNESDEKTSRIQALEVARDDAELRFLEADDKHAHAVMALRSIQTALGESLKVLDPKPEEPKVEATQWPPVQPMVPNDQSHAASLRQSEDGQPSTGSAEPSVGSGEAIPLGDHATSYAHTGQSDPDPTASGQEVAATQHDAGPAASGAYTPHSDPIPGQSDSLPIPAPAAQTGTGMEQGTTSSNSEVVHGPFFGKRYYEHQFYVRKDDWLNGGGTEADYEWRPPVANSAF